MQSNHNNLEKINDSTKTISKTKQLLLTSKIEELTEEIKNLQEAQKIANIGSSLRDLRNSKQIWSKEMFRILGLNPKDGALSFPDLLKKSIYADDINKVRNQIHNVINEKRSCEFEHRIVRPDGTVRSVIARFKPELDKEGKVVKVRGTIQDITERKKTVEELLSSQKRFKELVELLPEIFIETDKDLNIKYANESFKDISGYSEADIKKGISVLQLIDPEYMALAKKNIELIIKKGRKAANEYKLVKKDGSTIYGITNSNVIYNENGDFSGLRIVGIDISERKKHEDALKASEKGYKLLFENTIVGVYKTSIEGKYIDANPALVKLLGYDSKEELLKQDIRKQIYFSEKDRPEPNMRDKPFVVRLKKKDKTILWAEVSSSVYYENKKPQYYLGIVRDITVKKESEERLKQSYIKIQKTLEQTISVISHIVDIKDPYTSGHQKNVARIAIEIAKELGLSDEKIDAINIAALLHDIGKIEVPASILSKPGKLSELEFSMIKCHPKTGFDIIKGIDLSYPVAGIILEHHERLNGSGYPNGLKGKEICLEAKILAVADVVEAMSSHRPYRAAKGIEMAIEELKMNTGILYDKKVVDAFLSLTLDVKKIKSGEHLCALYDNPENQFSYVIPYIIGGLKRNEKCFYILDENTQENLQKAFTAADFDISHYLKSRQLVFYTKKETYLKDGYFEPEKMINLLKETEYQALKKGYKGIRVTGEMTWVFGNLNSLEKLIEYENQLNIFLPYSKVCAICQYNENKFEQSTLIDVIATHPKIVINGLIYKNNYFIQPDKFTHNARNTLKEKDLSNIKNGITKRILT